MFPGACDSRKHFDAPLSRGTMFCQALEYSSNFDNDDCTREKGLKVAFGRFLQKPESGR